LCEAVAGAGCSTYKGQSCLDYLMRRNLFLTRVGEKDNVFRYHHLFQTLLQLELKRRDGEAKRAALCKRASDWHAMMG
jgi:ATP/maltotriose-dependent transcriptional regulator MalT